MRRSWTGSYGPFPHAPVACFGSVAWLAAGSVTESSERCVRNPEESSSITLSSNPLPPGVSASLLKRSSMQPISTKRTPKKDEKRVCKRRKGLSQLSGDSVRLCDMIAVTVIATRDPFSAGNYIGIRSCVSRIKPVYHAVVVGLPPCGTRAAMIGCRHGAA